VANERATQRRGYNERADTATRLQRTRRHSGAATANGSAKGAKSNRAWGIAPGIAAFFIRPALKARITEEQSSALASIEARFQRWWFPDQFPGALPQAGSDDAPLALRSRNRVSKSEVLVATAPCRRATNAPTQRRGYKERADTAAH
jgi:hypothetical protein